MELIYVERALLSDLISNGPGKAVWEQAPPIRIERELASGRVSTDYSTEVRGIWSNDSLFFRFQAPYRTLSVFEPPLLEGKRIGLWNRDVVEVFISPVSKPRPYYTDYAEFQVAPTGEQLDLWLRLPVRDFLWESGFESVVVLDPVAKRWTTAIRIPFSAFHVDRPNPAVPWRVNFFRNVADEKLFLAWKETGCETAHRPESFGQLVFQLPKSDS